MTKYGALFKCKKCGKIVGPVYCSHEMARSGGFKDPDENCGGDLKLIKTLDLIEAL